MRVISRDDVGLALRRSAIFAGVLSLSIILGACRADIPETGGAPRSNANVELAQEGVRQSLVDFFSVAEVGGGVQTINFSDPAERRFFPSGWNQFQKDPKTSASFCWISDRNGVVDLNLVSTETAKVRMTVAPYPRNPGLMAENQAMAVHWNGEKIQRFVLDWKKQTIEFQVPAALARIGPNRMELRPNFWFAPQVLGERASIGVNRAVQFFEISLQQGSGNSRGSTSSMHATDRSIFQYPGSVATYYFWLPKAAAFRAKGRLKPPPLSTIGARSGALQVSLLAGEKPSRTLWSARVGDLVLNPEFVIDEDISELSDQAAAISLSFSAGMLESDPATTASLPVVEWVEPAIEGVRESPAVKGIEALRQKYNIVCILFDSLRADFTEPYGAAGARTPFMTSLARSGVTFQHARSASTFTRASVTSLMTGVDPSVHRVYSYADSLATSFPSVAELLKEAGYRTIAFSGNPTIDQASGLAKGFDHFKADFRGWRESHEEPSWNMGPEEKAKIIWETHIKPYLPEKGEAPFFVYLHELDPHFPYLPREPYRSMHEIPYAGNKDDLSRFFSLLTFKEVMPLDRPALQYLISQYRGEISYIDAFLGWIISRLKEDKLLENTLIVFLADHGEAFSEHGTMFHGFSLHEEEVHVPLIFSLKGVLPESSKIAVNVSLTDVAPTILDLIGSAIPPGMQGGSLLPFLVRAPDPSANRETYAGLQLFPSNHSHSVTDRGWKFLFNTNDKDKSAYRLYDLQTDPEELDDRFADTFLPGKVLSQQLRWRLAESDRLRSGQPSEAPRVPLSSETTRNLKALGYIN